MHAVLCEARRYVLFICALTCMHMEIIIIQQFMSPFDLVKQETEPNQFLLLVPAVKGEESGREGCRRQYVVNLYLY